MFFLLHSNLFRKKTVPMKEKNKDRSGIIILIATPIILAMLMGLFLMDIHLYNSTERSGVMSSQTFNGEVYDFGDVAVKLTVRGGESASWIKDPIYDDDGNELHGQSVGIIYEALIYNNSENVVSDWTLKVPINEPMWINNNWNSKMEIHQHATSGNEKVLAIDLSDYYEYDINLDYYIDHTGPMIPMDVGDYFIYLPEEIAEEKPINPAKTGEVGEACARFGYIVYIPDQTLDYSADFSGGEIRYTMHANPLTKKRFWVITVLFVLWAISAIVSLIVRYKMKKIMEDQLKQKKHDEMMVEQTMKLIINMIETKDTSTKGHSLRVAQYSELMARKLGFPEDKCKNVYYIGLLHDCGKVHIPDSILKNPGRLSDEEYAIMKKHTEYGAEVLKDFTSIDEIDVGAKSHHERYDGKGYPAGLAGEDIPLIARIIGVADAFDAMNSKRCYRDKLSREVILEELEKNRDKQFDSKLVDCLLELIEENKIEL